MNETKRQDVQTLLAILLVFIALGWVVRIGHIRRVCMHDVLELREKALLKDPDAVRARWAYMANFIWKGEAYAQLASPEYENYREEYFGGWEDDYERCLADKGGQKLIPDFR